jgi:dTDP-4-dehydrorhamnose 3,5-epimerase
MHFEPLGLAGSYLIRAQVVEDARGSFVKMFHGPTFRAQGLRTDWREEYHSSSVRDVVRGMHFQLPPADHAKLVFCVIGSVVDVIVDLRRGSPSFGEYRSVALSGAEGTGVYIPSGCAHGFVSTSDMNIMFYKVTSVYAPEADAGIAWDSIGFDWPVRAPIISDRDRGHPDLAMFDSPFMFDPGRPSR